MSVNIKRDINALKKQLNKFGSNSSPYVICKEQVKRILKKETLKN